MLTAMLAAFAGGIILNFMPCVFPIISPQSAGPSAPYAGSARTCAKRASAFAGHGRNHVDPRRDLTGPARRGTAVGWGFQLQSPLVIAFLALVILGAALNLLGVFRAGFPCNVPGR